MNYYSCLFILFFISCSEQINKRTFDNFSIDIPKSWEAKNNNPIDGFDLVFTNNQDTIMVSSSIEKNIQQINTQKIDTINNMIVKSFEENRHLFLYTIIGSKSIQVKANINSPDRLLKMKKILNTLSFELNSKEKGIINSDFVGNEIYSIDCLYCHGNKNYGLLLTKPLTEISQIRGENYLSNWIINKGNMTKKNSFLNKNATYKKCEIEKKYSTEEIKSLVFFLSKI